MSSLTSANTPAAGKKRRGGNKHRPCNDNITGGNSTYVGANEDGPPHKIIKTGATFNSREGEIKHAAADIIAEKKIDLPFHPRSSNSSPNDEIEQLSAYTNKTSELALSVRLQSKGGSPKDEIDRVFTGIVNRKEWLNISASGSDGASREDEKDKKIAELTEKLEALEMTLEKEGWKALEGENKALKAEVDSLEMMFKVRSEELQAEKFKSDEYEALYHDAILGKDLFDQEIQRLTDQNLRLTNDCRYYKKSSHNVGNMGYDVISELSDYYGA